MRLDDDALRRMREAARRPALDGPTAGTPEGIPPRLSPVPGPPAETVGVSLSGDGDAPGPTPRVRTIGPLRVDGILGKGGMGVVYRAWDPRLERAVAVKLLRTADLDDAEAVARLRREAQTAAGLQHPGIVAVHEVGTYEDAPYLVMELIEGTALAHALPQIRDRPLRERVDLLREIARAVAHAHERGVIHRDIKPSNILIDPTGRPHVLDFGLARRVMSPSSITLAGRIVGTPGYMAPEMIEGIRGEVGPRSDVFALGAVFYVLLTGTEAFPGETVHGILESTLLARFLPPRGFDRTISADLEAVCLLCLESEPGRRYADAGALADDLDRWLRGEPVRARPPSARRRWVAAARRHRLPIAAGACVLAATVAFAWAWRLVTARRVRDAEAAGLEAALRKSGLVSAVLVRFAALGGTLRGLETVCYDSRLDEDARQKAAEPLWPPVAGFMSETPPDAASQATMKALAGWARRLAGHEAEGIAWMDDARRLDPELPHAPALKALALLLRRAAALPMPMVLIEDDRVTVKSADGESPASTAIRREIETLLAETAGAPLWGGDLARECRRVVEALDALRRIDLAAAEEALTEALAMGMNVFRTEILYARAKVRILARRAEAAESDLQEVRTVRPHHIGVWRNLSWVRFERALEARRQGTDPREAYREAIACADEDVAGDPKGGEARGRRAMLRVALGEAEGAEGGDPRPFFRSALEDCTEAVQLDPRCDLALATRLNADQRLGQWQLAHGEDARPAFRDALDTIAAAQKLGVPAVRTPGFAGLLWQGMGEAEAAQGGDPGTSWARALADLEQALATSPPDRRAQLLGVRGSLRAVIAARESSQGRDPFASFDAALADLDEALRLEPQLRTLHFARGSMLHRRGDAAEKAGRDPRGDRRAAIDEFSAEIRTGPAWAAPHFWRANARFRIAVRPDTSPEERVRLLTDARADLDEALRRDPRMPEAWNLRGLTRNALAEFASATGADVRAECRSARTDLEECLKLRPGSADVHFNMALSGYLLATAQARRGEDPRGSYHSAIADLDRALELDPAHRRAHGIRATCWHGLGLVDSALRTDPKAAWERAEADFRIALERDPADAALLGYGSFLEQMRRPDEALPVYEALGGKFPAWGEWATRKVEELRRAGAGK